MSHLDLRTVLVGYGLCNFVCAIVLIFVWYKNHRRFKGLSFYAASFSINFIGIVLIGLRDVAPDFLALLLGNILIQAAVLLLYIGISNFLLIKKNQTINFVILTAYSVLQGIFIYLHPNLTIRIILFSFVLSIYCFQMTWMLFSYRNKQTQGIIVGLGFISILYWGMGIVRIIYTLLYPPGEQLFGTSGFEIAIYLLFQLIYIVLTFYLFFMVNQTLVVDLERDIEEKRIVKEELQISEEKFFTAFMSSPVPMLITVLKNGTILDANDAFLKLSGFEREELLSNSTLLLNVWNDPADRATMVEQIEKNGSLKNFHFLGRNKNNDPLHLVYSGEGILLNNEKCLISSLTDITDQVLDQKITQLKLSLWEYSADHTSIELMTSALDEIELITNSKISFFHLVNEAKKSLLLQAWSTQTKEKFCKAAGENTHYPVEKAGIWADCIRRKEPVIHNDYDAVANKKGLPAGHAVVVRELVVPVMEKGRVEAVLGVGNKETEYTEKDLLLVQKLADLVWEIIRQKHADEKILQLNEKLEKLAMIDELTQIMNRRAFFLRGEEEIKRARRHHLPISAIMLDIDKFKNINDTYGHDTGDYILSCFASMLKSHIREIDIVGRIGGEEFGILLPNTKAEDAMKLAERIRQYVQTGNCISQDVEIKLTASFGVAQYHLDLKDLDELLKEADIALYQAKNAGRNKVVLFKNE